MSDVRDEPLVYETLDKLGTMLEHRAHIEQDFRFAWEYYGPGYKDVEHAQPLSVDERLAFLDLAWKEVPPYDHMLEAIYGYIVSRLPDFEWHANSQAGWEL